jgi:hypothetical protein
MGTQVITVPGVGELEFPDSMTDAQIRAVLKRKLPELRAAPGVGTLPVEAAPFLQQARAQMLGENAAGAAFLAGTAAGARMLPGTAAQVAAPGLGGRLVSQMGLAAAGEALGEMIEAPVTGEGLSPGKIALAPAFPVAARAVGGALTGATALPAAIQRTGQRLLPGRFQAAQEGAQAALRGTVGQFADEAAGAGAAFQASKAAAGHGSTLPAAPLAAMVDDVAATAIPEDKPVQDVLALVRSRIQPDGTISLTDLERLRRYLGKQGGAGTAKEVRALQKGLYETLEQAAQSTPGAADLREALRLHKLGRAAELLDGFLTKPGVMSQMPQGGPGAGPALNVPAFIKQVDKHRQELTAMLGAAGMAKLDAMLQQIRTVPPKMAYNLVNVAGQSLASGVGVALGAMSGLGPPAVMGALGGLAGVGVKELGQNWVAVTRTPEGLKRFLNLTMLGANALMRTPTTRAPSAP